MPDRTSELSLHKNQQFCSAIGTTVFCPVSSWDHCDEARGEEIISKSAQKERRRLVFHLIPSD
jgi:hypothetical protein